MNLNPQFAGTFCQWHNQTFACEIEGDHLYLCVRNEDETWKRLGPSAEIRPAQPVTREWEVQTKYEGSVGNGRTITTYNRKTGTAYTTEKEERKWLVMALAGALLDKVTDFFPGNRHVQLADPAQTEVTKERLVEIRKGLGMTQEEFGEYVSAARRTVQDWEGGHRKVPASLVEILRLKGHV